ncbi:MAG: excinuclease ABC subunit UvrA, partial [Bacteroidaceae bacterium]|nr:excinuclease ABC subunit UvrA [Bacteroidaceae bacterium]
MAQQEFIIVEGARVHNLKNVDVKIPRGSLTVITGLSGSGKSSLAFDTIYAEGQRRYIETFSAYARNFLGNLTRPDVDKISGLSPVISIEQKTTNKNPRSTVGTTTEIYDFFRLLYARAGEAFSYVTGEKMVHYSEKQILDLILKRYRGHKLYIMAPMVKNRKGHYRELFESLRRKGYLYARVDGEIEELLPGMKLDRYRNHDVEVVVDRLKIASAASLKEDASEDYVRLLGSIRTAMKEGSGAMMVCDADTGDVHHYSRRLMCPTSGISYRDPAPHDFSFNSPQGACPHCKGLGYVVVNRRGQEVGDYDEDEVDGDDGKLHRAVCPECGGQRLCRESLHYRIDGKNIAEVSAMDLAQLKDWLTNLDGLLNDHQKLIAPEILKEIRTRLDFLLDVGLDYLSLSRSSATLSGGESQRIRLATQIGSGLVNVLYILDEPSIGLHQRDNERLISSLKKLRDMGNTVIVVEHDEEMMQNADWIVDIGPRAGRKGGEVVFQGTYKDMLKTDTLTSLYLSGRVKMPVPEKRRKGNGNRLVLHGASGNNLKHVDVAFPLGCLIGVTGVSGSGKSTLVNETLHPILSQKFYRSLKEPLPYDSLEGMDFIDKVVCVDQSPIGRTPRSNPATYTGVFSDIRNLFVNLPEAKIRGYKPGRFSFNVKGGRCEVCGGNGYRSIEMNFLPDVMVPCEECRGKRYNRETLEVRFKGKSIADVLDMTINQAVEFFENQPDILRRIKTLQDVGLGYIKLGQSSTTLSGGESQRVKLATELAKRDTGRTLFILDEPTTGLHFDDIRVLLEVLDRLVDKGNTVLVIEHNLDIIRACDWLIEMGPEGGRE